MSVSFAVKTEEIEDDKIKVEIIEPPENSDQHLEILDTKTVISTDIEFFNLNNFVLDIKVEDIKVENIKVEETEIQPRYECYVCNYFVENVDGLRCHIKKHVNHGEQKIPCQKKIAGREKHSTSGNLNRQAHSVHLLPSEKFACDKCPKKYNNRRCLRQHERTHGDPLFECDQCLKVFWRKQSFVRHKGTHSAVRSFKCDGQGGRCHRSFSTRNSLQRHKATTCISSEAKFECYICRKATATISALRNHMVSHMGEKSFACDECPNKYFRKRYLTEHKRTHSTVKPFQCSICLKTFRIRSRLNEHRRVHSGEKPYSCNECPRTFRWLASLRIHQSTHTGEKSFMCSVCSKKFSRESTLNAHKIIHVGKKLFPCNECEKKYSSKQSLWNHKKYYHRKFHSGSTRDRHLAEICKEVSS